MRQMDFLQSKNLLKNYNIRVADSEICHTRNHAAEVARRYGFPVVMKVISPDIVHKTDVGGVKVNVMSSDAVLKAYDEIEKNVRKHMRTARIDGILVQKQAEGREIIIGGKRDPQFGPVVLFGLGGIYVEVFGDVSMRVAPVDKREAEKMVREIKGYPILKGERGQKPVNFEDLHAMIARVSNLMMNEEDIKEMDLNPCFSNERDCTAADVRLIIE